MSGLSWKNEGGELWEASFWEVWHAWCDITDVTYDLCIAYPHEPLVDDIHEAADRVEELVYTEIRRLEAVLDAAEDGP